MSANGETSADCDCKSLGWIEKARKSCVTVKVSGDHGDGLGSGFVWRGSADEPHEYRGIVVTNKHVVGSSRKQKPIICVFEANQRIPATVLISDRPLDLAILQLDVKEAEAAGIVLAGSKKPDELELGLFSRGVVEGSKIRGLHSSDYATRAETVYSFGSPLYQDRSDTPPHKQVKQVARRIITKGIVSGFHYGNLDASELIVTDAVIERGMSGGPVVAGKDRNVIAVNVSGSMGINQHPDGEIERYYLGLNGTVPAYWIDYLWHEWLGNKDCSYPRRGDLGLQEQPRSRQGEDGAVVVKPASLERVCLDPAWFNADDLESLCGQTTAAAVRRDPDPGSPAYEASVRKDDIILEFDGVTIDDPSRLIGALDSTTIGYERELKVLKVLNGERKLKPLPITAVEFEFKER